MPTVKQIEKSDAIKNGYYLEWDGKYYQRHDDNTPRTMRGRQVDPSQYEQLASEMSRNVPQPEFRIDVILPWLALAALFSFGALVTLCAFVL